jgi:hypothetical protein
MTVPVGMPPTRRVDKRRLMNLVAVVRCLDMQAIAQRTILVGQPEHGGA